MVEDVIESLADSEISMIAKRGIAIISTLLGKEQGDRARGLNIPQLIHNFCVQERHDPGRRRASAGDRSGGWPPNDKGLNSEDMHNQSDHGQLSNDKESRTLGGIPTGLSGTSTPVDSVFSYRHTGDEEFPDLVQPGMSSLMGSHCWEDIMLLAQNYVL